MFLSFWITSCPGQVLPAPSHEDIYMEAVGHTYVGVNIQRQSDIHIVGIEGHSPGVKYIRRDSNNVEH